MNEIKIFEFNTKEIRAIIIDNEPWFIAKDICNILEVINNRDAISRLDADEKDVVSTDTLGGSQKTTIISEAGLYSLILSSKKKEAREFKRWVTHEVIPSIRKNGIYATDITIEKMINDPDFAIQLLITLKEERNKRIEAEQLIEEQKPRVEFADNVLKSKDNILVREFAKIMQDNKIYDFGEKKLYKWFRENNYLMQNNEPYQQYMKYFVVEEKTIETAYGQKLRKTSKVTPQGQVYFCSKLKG